MQVTEKLLDKARDRRKTLKKRKRKTKNDKKSNNKYHFILTFLYRKIYIFLENIFGET